MMRLQAISGFCSVLALAYAFVVWECGLLWFAPIAGSYVIVFGQPDSPMARVRSLAGGHLVAFAAGAAMCSLTPDTNVSVMLATCAAFAMMVALDCVHSPAGATPAAVILSGSSMRGSAVALVAGVALALAAKWALQHLPPQRR